MKNIIACFVCLVTSTVSTARNFTDTLKLPTGQNGTINLILDGIKTEKENVKTAEANLAAAKADQDIKKTGLETKMNARIEEARAIYAAHNNKHPEGGPEHIYWNNKLAEVGTMITTYSDALKALQTAVNDAQTAKDKAEESIKQKQAELLEFVKMNSNTDCAKQLSQDSPIEAVVQCWNCLFDNNCCNYGPPPTSPFDINNGGAPIKNYGAPPIMGGAFRNQQLQNISNNIEKIKVPPPPPPQKGKVEEATDKVRGYFRDVINKSKHFKNRVTAVLAVRG